MKKRVTVTDFAAWKREKRKITALTAYDALFASMLDDAGIDVILVGDSLANVFQGHDTTIPVTIDHMIYHGSIVARSVSRSFVVVDMPFLSFQVNEDTSLANAGRIMQETLCQAVKLEGGRTVAPVVRRIVTAGIPVLGHLGLTPQFIHTLGGYGVRGKDDADQMVEDALALQEAGAFAVVLEKIPRDLAARISETLAIPTLGIGAGNACDGQILVTPDLLGLFDKFKPAFVRRYAHLHETVADAVRSYRDDVASGAFPSDEESFE